MAIKTFLTSEEIQRMIANCQYLRDRALLAFYADSGCRVSELLSLKVENIDFDSGEVLIPHLKRGVRKKCPQCGFSAGRSQKFCAKCGTDLIKIQAEGVLDRSRLISIGDFSLNLLREFTADMAPGDHVFNLSRQWVYYIVRKAAESIGLKGKVLLNPETRKRHYVHPHSLRDSLAVDWLDFAGSDVTKQKALQDHLGHQSFGTTTRYHKLTPKQVKNVGDQVRKNRFGDKS
jgi:integrase